MDLLIITYAVLTVLLSAIELEEVRDLHYFPFLGTLGLAVVGIVLAGTSLAAAFSPSIRSNSAFSLISKGNRFPSRITIFDAA